MNENTEHKSVPAPAPEKKRKMSFGERVFDFTLYGPVNFFGTLFLTAWMAFSLEYGARGKVFFEALSGGLKSAGLKGKLPYEITKTTSLMMGGNAMLIPVKIAEHNKVGIATTLNRWTGDKTDPKDIEAVPKQTWGSLISGRLIAWLIVFGSFRGAGMFIGKQFGEFEHNIGKWLADIYKQPTHRAPLAGEEAAETLMARQEGLGKELEALGKEGAKTKAGMKLADDIEALGKTIKGMETKPYAYGKIFALDVFATLMATSLLYVSSRFVANRREQRKAAKEVTKEHASTPPLVQVKAQEQPKIKDEEKPRAEVLANSVAKESPQQAATSLSV